MTISAVVQRSVVLAVLAVSVAAFAADGLDKDMEGKLLPYINQMRSSKGLAPLTAGEPAIAEAARMHLEEFARRQQVADQYDGEPRLTERLRAAKVASGAAGEIMLMIPNTDAPVADLFEKDSVREAVLNPKFAQAGFAATRVDNMTYVVANFVQPLRMLSSDEVENRIVQSLQALRSSQKIMAFKAPPMRRLRAAACDMAKKDSAKAPSINPYADFMGAPSTAYRNLAYTTADPTELPGGLSGVAADPKMNAVSVGVCFAETPSHPGGTYWVALLFYSR